MFKSPLNSTFGGKKKNFSFLLFDVSLYSLLMSNLKQWEKVKVFLSYSILLSISHSYTVWYTVSLPLLLMVGFFISFWLTNMTFRFCYSFERISRGIDSISQKGNSNFSQHQILQVLAEFLLPINQSMRWPKI